jgi:hypothetical protein
MPKGKPWTKEEENKLKSLAKSGSCYEDMARELKKSKGAIKAKLQRMDLEVVVMTDKKSAVTTTSFDLPVPDDLPSVEMQLRVLAGAIKKLQKDNLSKTDVMRLGRLIAGVGKYKELFADYVGYREIEQKVDYALEWMRKRDEERKNLDRVKSKTE